MQYLAFLSQSLALPQPAGKFGCKAYPRPTAACLPPLDFMLEAFPLQEVISKMLHGTADCAEVTWTLLGLNIAEFSMINFLTMLAFSVFIVLRKSS